MVTYSSYQQGFWDCQAERLSAGSSEAARLTHTTIPRRRGPYVIHRFSSSRFFCNWIDFSMPVDSFSCALVGLAMC
jgi:hypothetical protein